MEVVNDKSDVVSYQQAMELTLNSIYRMEKTRTTRKFLNRNLLKSAGFSARRMQSLYILCMN